MHLLGALCGATLICHCVAKPYECLNADLEGIWH